MTDIRRYRVAWSGLTGLPGVSTFYCGSAITLGSELSAFFTSIKNQFPAPLTWTVPNSGDLIDDATGDLTGAWSGSGGTAVASSSSGAYMAGTGAYVQWNTGSIVNGRRLKGRTFLCPIKSDNADSAGVISSASHAVLDPALATLVAAGKVMVWHRPTTPGGTDGVAIVAGSASVAPNVTSLTTRRS